MKKCSYGKIPTPFPSTPSVFSAFSVVNKNENISTMINHSQPLSTRVKGQNGCIRLYGKAFTPKSKKQPWRIKDSPKALAVCQCSSTHFLNQNETILRYWLCREKSTSTMENQRFSQSIGNMPMLRNAVAPKASVRPMPGAKKKTDWSVEKSKWSG
jgi:hypothetical protein